MTETSRQKKVLVINPNSSEKVTGDMEAILAHNSGIDYDFYTAPSAAPKEISGTETSIKSERVVLPDLVDKRLLNYDGYLVCCYSDHPLIYSLKTYTSKPIMGIMHGTLLYSMMNPSLQKSIIITSFSSWEPILDEAIMKFFDTDKFPSNRMAATKSLDINVVNLNNPETFQAIVGRVALILKGDAAIDCVLLGCAGMVGLDAKLAAQFPGIKFIDGDKISMELLTSLIRFES